jgi:hypothetical protein
MQFLLSKSMTINADVDATTVTGFSAGAGSGLMLSQVVITS